MPPGLSLPHPAFAVLMGRILDGVDADDWTTSFRFGDRLLQVECCLWRVVEERRLRMSSDDHEHLYGRERPVDAPAEALALLGGRRVAAVATGSLDADVVLLFEGDLRLEILPRSSGYESWQLIGPAGTNRILGSHGGSVSEIPGH